MSRKRQNENVEPPEEERIFRCWVEVRELTTGIAREIPLNRVRKIYFPRKKADPGRPDENVLQLKDGPDILEALSLDELATQLRARYPDELYERRLFKARDREAEKRRTDAWDDLLAAIAEAAVERLLREEAAKSSSSESGPLPR